MELIDIIKEGISYPTTNYKNLLILGIILTFIQVLGQIGLVNGEYSIIIIGGVLGFILSIFTYGYSLDIINEGIDNSLHMPIINQNDFIKGIKALIVSIVYYIIPLIIIGATVFLTGLVSSFSKLMYYVGDDINSASVNTTELINTIPQDVVISFGTSFLITLIISAIVFIIFTLFAEIGFARLADTDSIKEALSIGKVYNKISEIGWIKYIGFMILELVIILVLFLIYSLVSVIPIVGFFIASLIILPYIFLFTQYSLGLLYGDI